jgi:hypothetical protein
MTVSSHVLRKKRQTTGRFTGHSRTWIIVDLAAATGPVTKLKPLTSCIFVESDESIKM